MPGLYEKKDDLVDVLKRKNMSYNFKSIDRSNTAGVVTGMEDLVSCFIPFFIVHWNSASPILYTIVSTLASTDFPCKYVTGGHTQGANLPVSCEELGSQNFSFPNSEWLFEDAWSFVIPRQSVSTETDQHQARRHWGHGGIPPIIHRGCI